MTEDEAKTKRCPVGAGEMARCEQAFVSLNTYTSRCIGSACMAWREIAREYIADYKFDDEMSVIEFRELLLQELKDTAKYRTLKHRIMVLFETVISEENIYQVRNLRRLSLNWYARFPNIGKLTATQFYEIIHLSKTSDMHLIIDGYCGLAGKP